MCSAGGTSWSGLRTTELTNLYSTVHRLYGFMVRYYKITVITFEITFSQSLPFCS